MGDADKEEEVEEERVGVEGASPSLGVSGVAGDSKSQRSENSDKYATSGAYSSR